MARLSVLSARVYLPVLMGALLLFTACGPAATPTPTPAPTATSTPTPAATPTPTPTPVAAGMFRAPEASPKRGGVLKTAWGITTPHYDIHQGAFAWVMAQMYDTLVRWNPTDGLRSIAPALATSYEVSPDGLTYIFRLREGVKFQDGTPLTAEDVAATFNRILSPPSGITSSLKDQFDGAKRAEVVDKFTVKFVLSSPRSYLLEVMSDPSAVVYSKKSLDENNQDLRKVIVPGTGPFKHKNLKEAEVWAFEANRSYWNPSLPYLDELQILHVPVGNDRGSAILTGQADFSWNTGLTVFNEAMKRRDIMRGVLLPVLGAVDWTFNVEKKPWTDSRVRQAIHLAIDRQAAIEVGKSVGGVWVLSRWMSPISDYATPESETVKLPAYRPNKADDIAEAKRLLSSAGYPDGFGPVDLVTTLPDPMSVLLQDHLKRSLNVTINIRSMERAAKNEVYSTRQFDIVQGTTIPLFSAPDPAPWWNLTVKTGASLNHARYSNPEFDKLLAQISAENDFAKRKVLVDQAMDVLDKDPPYFNFFGLHTPLWRSYVKGLNMEGRRFSEWRGLDLIWLDK